MKRIVFLISIFLFSISTFSNNIDGKVFEIIDGEKKPLIGASVYWMNTTIGTSTSSNGSFTIERSLKVKYLIASYVGYNQDTVVVASTDNSVEFVLISQVGIEEAVITKRRVGTHMNRLDPIATHNITGAELCKAACCNLSESFETNASVDVTYSDAVSGAKQIHLLGLAGTYVQMMTENIPNLRGLATPYGLGYIPGSWMSAIKVSKGTSSVKNGYEAITGQINVEYKKPFDEEKFFLNAFASNSGKVETNLNASYKMSDKWAGMILFHAEDMSAEHDDNNDGFMDMPKTRQFNFINRWHYKSGKKFDARFGVKLLKEDRLGGQIDNNSDGSRYAIDINSERYELFYKNGIVLNPNKNRSIGFISSFTNHDQNTQIGLRDYVANQKSLYFNVIYQSEIGSEMHNYKFGASYKYDLYDELFVSKSEETEISVPGIFAEYSLNLNSKLTALAGARVDFHNLNGAFFTPRIHLKYNPFNLTHIRTSIGKGFRRSVLYAENIGYMASSRAFIIDPDLERLEEAVNYGVNITQEVNIGEDKKLSFNAEYYRTDFKKKIIADFDSDFREVRFYNLEGESYSESYQAEINTMPIENLEIVLAYRYNIVKETINNVLQDKPLVNKYKGLFNVSYSTPLEKWQVDFTAQFNGGGRLPTTSQLPEDMQRGEEFDPYTILNAQLTKYFRWGSIYIGAENLTGFTQENPIIDPENPFGNNFDSSSIWGPLHGRKFFIGFRWAIDRE